MSLLKFGDSRLNSGRIIRLSSGQPDPFLVAFCSRHEAASDAKSGRFVRLIVPISVKFCDPCLNRSREFPPVALRGDIFNIFCDNFRLEAVSDIISGVATE